MKISIPLLGLLGLLSVTAAAHAADRSIPTSDGYQLHAIESGQGPTLVFVPGWTMPAWIFQPQIARFSQHYHVVAFDPRGQGDSDVPPAGYTPARRAEDIADVLAQCGDRPVVLVGWSLGVLDALSYVRRFGDAKLAGLVLIDNSIGEDPPPSPERGPRGPRLDYAAKRRAFIEGMFHHPQSEDYIDRLTEASLRTPREAAAALLNYPVPRTEWRDAVYSVRKPILYVVRPHLAGQAANLAARDPDAQTAMFADAGHALFVDDAERFNTLLANFLHRVWP